MKGESVQAENGLPIARDEQERFWADTYAREYIERNRSFDFALGVQGWRQMMHRADVVTNILECGCNIGRNLGLLGNIYPAAGKSIIEISKPAYDQVTATQKLHSSFNGTILESNLPPRAFDLVFTMGVLIHIHPDKLISNMQKMFDYSNKYVLIGEYFNRTPTMIEYKGERDRLFKCDFGRIFVENFDVAVVDYGFLWGHVYDKAGFDDVTWWLFRKNGS